MGRKKKENQIEPNGTKQNQTEPNIISTTGVNEAGFSAHPHLHMGGAGREEQCETLPLRASHGPFSGWGRALLFAPDRCFATDTNSVMLIVKLFG